MMNAKTLAAILALAAAVVAVPLVGRAGDDEGKKDEVKAGTVDGKTAFKRLKTLAGEWTAKVDGGPRKDEHDEASAHSKMIYRVTAAGSVVMETFFPGSPHEMISMYHLDGDKLIMTHYCAAQNQPHLKLDTDASTPDELVFVFDGGTNLDPEKDVHIHSGRIRFLDDGSVEGIWEACQGEKSFGTTTFTIVRE